MQFLAQCTLGKTAQLRMAQSTKLILTSYVKSKIVLVDMAHEERSF